MNCSALAGLLAVPFRTSGGEPASGLYRSVGPCSRMSQGILTGADKASPQVTDQEWWMQDDGKEASGSPQGSATTLPQTENVEASSGSAPAAPASPATLPPPATNLPDQHHLTPGRTVDTPIAEEHSHADPGQKKGHAPMGVEGAETGPPPSYSAATSISLPGKVDHDQEPIWLQQSA